MKNICDWNNCSKEGNYKAPKERDNSKKFQTIMFRACKRIQQKMELFFRNE